MTKIPMTVHGSKLLIEELRQLKTVSRPEIIADIAAARAHGDLKENAEYHAARERQAFCERRVAAIENKLSNAQIINVTKIANDGKVIFGATVTLLHLKQKYNVIYTVVGDDEADIKNNKISIYSPVARALIGQYLYSVIVVSTPNEDIEYKIIEVQYS